MRPLPPVSGHAVQPASFFDSVLADTDTENDEAPIDSIMEERVKALEENYKKLGDENAELKKSLKSLVAPGHEDVTMRLTGRIHMDYWAFPESSPAINVFENNDPNITPQDRFGFRRLRFGVAGRVWQNMVYRIDMEFAQGNDVEFRDAFFGWTDLPVLQELLVGNQKRPYSLDQINSSNVNVFLERPFVAEADDQAARRLGIESYGFSEDLAWNWRYGVFNLANVQATGSYTGDHLQGEVAGRLANTFWYDEASDGRGWGHWAIAANYADTDGIPVAGDAPSEARFRTRPEAQSVNRWIDTGVIPLADTYNLCGVENIWNFGPLQLCGEYMNVWVQRHSDTTLHFDGGYVYAAYFLTGENMTWDRESGQLDRIQPWENFFLVDTCNDGVRGGWGAWQIAYRLSYGNYTDDDIFGGRGLSHTLGLNWWWNTWARMQFNALYGEIDDHEGFDEDGNSLGVLSGHYTILGTRFCVDF